MKPGIWGTYNITPRTRYPGHNWPCRENVKITTKTKKQFFPFSRWSWVFSAPADRPSEIPVDDSIIVKIKKKTVSYCAILHVTPSYWGRLRPPISWATLENFTRVASECHAKPQLLRSWGRWFPPRRRQKSTLQHSCVCWANIISIADTNSIFPAALGKKRSQEKYRSFKNWNKIIKIKYSHKKGNRDGTTMLKFVGWSYL